MGSVVFLRAVNVGGHQKFRPSALAKDLADFGVVNIGAAGSFIVREAVKPAVLKEQIYRRLHFKPEVIICPATEILALCDDEHFRDSLKIEEVKPFVTVLPKVPRKIVRFPIEQPAGDEWQVRVLGIRGRFVLSLYRKMEQVIAYPNAVVEKKYGLPATTRTWSTITTIYKMLEQDLLAEVF